MEGVTVTSMGAAEKEASASSPGSSLTFLLSQMNCMYTIFPYITYIFLLQIIEAVKHVIEQFKFLFPVHLYGE